MKKINIILIPFLVLLFITGCEKKTPAISDLDRLRNSSNTKSYPAVQMDSLQAINSITKQKVQEVLDLSTLYLNGNKNTNIDSAIYRQMESYFYKPDSLTFKGLFSEISKYKVKSAKVNNLEVYKTFHKKDTLDYARFNVEYFDANNRSIGTFDKDAQYILVPYPIRKKEFKFYFIGMYEAPPKDSTSVEVTK